MLNIRTSGLLNGIELCDLFSLGKYFTDNVLQFLQEKHHYGKHDAIYNVFEIDKNGGKILRELVMCPDDMIPDFGSSREGWIGVRTEVIGVIEIDSANPNRHSTKLTVYEVSGIINHVTDNCQFIMFRDLKYSPIQMRRDHGIININNFFKPSHGYIYSIGKFSNVTGKV